MAGKPTLGTISVLVIRKKRWWLHTELGLVTCTQDATEQRAGQKRVGT
jgi:hypothetical protein